NSTRRRSQRPARRQPQVERLEDRTLLNAGALDPTFGEGGRLSPSIFPSTVTFQLDGKMLVGGTIPVDRYEGPDDDLALARYNADGTPDTSFGTSGQVSTNLDFNHDYGYSFEDPITVRVLPNNQIVAVTYLRYAGNLLQFGWARYNADGSLDTTLG